MTKAKAKAKRPKNTTENTTHEIKREPGGKFAKGHSANPSTLWKPGQTGNPNGRPKLLTDELRILLKQKVPNDAQARSYAKLFIQSILQRSITKSDVMAKEIFDRIEGKASMSDEDASRQQSTVSVIVVDVPRPDRSKIINVPPIKKAIPAQD